MLYIWLWLLIWLILRIFIIRIDENWIIFILVWSLIGVLTAIFFTAGTEKIVEKTPIVSINDWNYANTEWTFVSVTTEDTIVYRYTEKLTWWRYQQKSIEWNVVIQEEEWRKTGAIYSHKKKAVDPKWYNTTIFIDKSVQKYVIKVPQWSVVKDYVFDNE